ncbi:uncharacterized protein A1O9_09120 [Exophiala aquamarina CBS 119918]|uniref:Orc1-like AAA ATPase domain-containing protein n=1 Tax=Exophiala aquamarina CBS 119918 TaxID=1182545 RepID=A0A072P5X5_9EURO|nr:uncharacterized protein A1O9_09120 [Exophiala aquamarina CBS 119918]KEF54678.1 hypothetical protein A1O9_09120 [Exophiala aquamarina CBS 119918]
MVALLPLELLQAISHQHPCRDSQIRQLATYYNVLFPSPSTLVVCGLEQASELAVVTSVLEARKLKSVVVRSKDCLSQRHLLSKIFATCVHGLGQQSQIEHYDKVDSLNALLGNLRKLFERAGHDQRLVLILEDINKQKQAGPTLLPALARLGDQIPGLCLILTSSSPQPLALLKSGVPYIHFPPYNRAEAIYIVATSPPKLHPESLLSNGGYTPQTDEASLRKIYPQFCATVYDSLISSTSSTSVQKFRSTCEKLWPRFIWPMVSGESPPGKAASWDFARLLVRNRGLFQAQGENALHEQLRPRDEAWSFAELAAISTDKDHPQLSTETESSSVPSTSSKRASTASSALEKSSKGHKSLAPTPRSTNRLPPLLKQFPTLLLLSSYLASTTPSKHDILLFSRLSSNSSHISKKIRRLKSTPTRRKAKPTGTTSVTNNPGTSTPSKSRITKQILSASGSGAGTRIVKPFSLERLLAILRAIHPSGIPNQVGKGVSDRVYRELGELERLRLVVRSSSGSGGGAAGSSTAGASASAALDDATEEKWRVNVGRDWVVAMGHLWGLTVSDYEIEGDL